MVGDFGTHLVGWRVGWRWYAVVVLGPTGFSLAALDVPGRVAAQLLALAGEYGEPSAGGATRIPLPLTQSDLAALVGASRVRVNQAIAFFKKRGCISVGADHRIIIHNPEPLAQRAH